MTMNLGKKDDRFEGISTREMKSKLEGHGGCSIEYELKIKIQSIK